MSLKDAVIEMIKALPDNVTWAEIRAEGYARFGKDGHSRGGSGGSAQTEVPTPETPQTPE